MGELREARIRMKNKKLLQNIDKDRWIKCGNNDLDINDFKGLACYAAIDIDSSNDLAALSLVFPMKKTNIIEYYGFCYFWIYKKTINDHPQYKLFNKAKHLVVIKGDPIGYKIIVDDLKILNDHFDIKEIIYDRWGNEELLQNLESNGFTVFPFGQGYIFMSPATKCLFNLLGKGRFYHENDPLLNWMADNTIFRSDPAGSIKPDKSKSEGSINGIVSMIMALDRSTYHFIKKENMPDPILEDIKNLKNSKLNSFLHKTDSTNMRIEKINNGLLFEYEIKPIYFKNPDNLLKLKNTIFKDIDNINKKIEEVLNEV